MATTKLYRVRAASPGHFRGSREQWFSLGGHHCPLQGVQYSSKRMIMTL